MPHVAHCSVHRASCRFFLNPMKLKPVHHRRRSHARISLLGLQQSRDCAFRLKLPPNGNTQPYYVFVQEKQE